MAGGAIELIGLLAGVLAHEWQAEAQKNEARVAHEKCG
jgi:hypothetical protein